MVWVGKVGNVCDGILIMHLSPSCTSSAPCPLHLGATLNETEPRHKRPMICFLGHLIVSTGVHYHQVRYSFRVLGALSRETGDDLPGRAEILA